MTDLRRFSVNELRTALNIILDLQEATDQNQALEVFFHHLHKSLSWTSCTFFGLDPIITEPVPSSHYAMNIENPDDVIHNYAQYFYAIDPLLLLELPENRNRVLRTEDVVSLRKYRHTEYYTDFSQPLHIETSMACCACISNKPLFGIALHLDKPGNHFTDRQRDLFELLIPNLARTIHALEFQRVKITESQPHEPAMWQLNAKGEIIQLNDTARLFSEKNYLMDANPFPAEVTHLVQDIYTYKTPITIPMVKQILYPLNNPQIRFTLIANGPQEIRNNNIHYTILAEDLDDNEVLNTRIAALKLTRREREISILVAKGHTYREIAERLGIKEQTVRDHLRSIFRKSAVNNRSALTALLLNR
jgi:DNA-binding CsgD family transcriptional regulator